MTGKGSGRAANQRPAASREARRRAELERRRQAGRRSAQLAARKRRNRIIAGGLAAVLIIGAVATTFAVVRRQDPAAASTELNAELVENPTGDLVASDPASAYKVVYEIRTVSGDTDTTTTEEITVRRPFDSVLTAKKGTAPGGDTQWQLISTLGKYSEATAGGTPQVQVIAPRSALGDYRFDASLDDLVTDGYFEPRERRTALGRECQVYRTGSPVESFGTSKPTATNYSDVCIDATGLPLEEVSVSAGVLSSRLAAISIDDAFQPADDTFAVTGDPVAVAAGGATLTPIDTATVPVAGYWVPATPPAGYTLQGRYHLQRAVPEADTAADATTTTTTAPATPAVLDSYIDVYVNGVDTIVIHQGPVAAEPASEATNGADVQAGAMGAAKISTGLAGATLLAHPATPAPWFVEVAGTVSQATVQAVANDLHAYLVSLDVRFAFVSLDRASSLALPSAPAARLLRTS